MLKIEIETDEVAVRSGISKKSGNPYTLREQWGWVHIPGVRYPQRITFMLEDDQAPYEPGEYIVDPAHSFYIGRFGSLEIKVKLIRRTESPRKVA